MAKLTSKMIKDIVADWPNLTLAQLREKYDVSSASISNTVAKLRQLGVAIEKKRTAINWQELASELKKKK